MGRDLCRGSWFNLSISWHHNETDLKIVNDSVNLDTFYLMLTCKKQQQQQKILLLVSGDPEMCLLLKRKRKKLYFQDTSSLNSCQQRTHLVFFQKPMQNSFGNNSSLWLASQPEGFWEARSVTNSFLSANIIFWLYISALRFSLLGALPSCSPHLTGPFTKTTTNVVLVQGA